MQVGRGQAVVTNGSSTVYGVHESGLSEDRYTANQSAAAGSKSQGDVFVGTASGATLRYVALNGSTVFYDLLSGTPQNEQFEKQGDPAVTMTLDTHVRTPFQLGEGLTFALSGATAFFAGYDPNTGTFYYYNVSGGPVSDPDRVSGDVSDAAGRVAGPNQPTQWASGVPAIPSQPAFPSLFNRRGMGVSYEIASIDAEDELTLTQAYSQLTEYNVPYRVSVDFDADTGLPLINPGDVDVPALWSRLIVGVKGLLGNALGLFTSPPGFVGNALKTTRINSTEDGLELYTPAVASDPDGNDTRQVISKNTSFYSNDTRWLQLLAMSDGGGPSDFGGRLSLEAASDSPDQNDIHLEVRNIAVVGDEDQRAFDVRCAGNVLPSLRVTMRDRVVEAARFALSQAVVGPWVAGWGDGIYDDPDAVAFLYEVALTNVSGTFEVDEIIDFGTSGAVGQVRNIESVGNPTLLVVHFPKTVHPPGSGDTGETVGGRRSGASGNTTEQPHPITVDAGLTAGATIIFSTNPGWVVDEHVGRVMQVLQGGSRFGEYTINGNTINSIEVATAPDPPFTAETVFRIINSGDATVSSPRPLRHRVDGRPYITSRVMASNQAITSAGGETELSDLSGDTIDGADGARAYVGIGWLHIQNDTASVALVKAKVYLGPNGDTSDPAVTESWMSVVASGYAVLHLAAFEPEVDPGDILTVTVETDEDITVLGAAGGRQSQIRVSENRAR